MEQIRKKKKQEGEKITNEGAQLNLLPPPSASCAARKTPQFMSTANIYLL